MGFIDNTEDMIVFVACVSGVFGVLLVITAVFFIAEKLELFKTKNKSRPIKNNQNYEVADQDGFQRNLQNPRHPNDDPMWFYNNNASIPKATSTENERDKHNATDAYINDVFSDIILENDQAQKTTVAYEVQCDKDILDKSKPSKLLQYKNSKSKKLKNKEIKDKRMIGMEKETKKETGEFSTKNFTMIAVEAGNNKENAKDIHEEDEDKVKILLSLESEKHEKTTKEDKSQLLYYENPKNVSRERQMQEEMRKDEHKKRESKKTKVVAVESNFSFGKPNMVRQESKVQRRIII